MTISGITTFLWFDRDAEEAANFYVSLFPSQNWEASRTTPKEGSCLQAQH